MASLQPTPLYSWGCAPCDGCPLARRCRAQLEACAAFALYLNGESEKRWRAVSREPRNDLYVSLLADQADRARGLGAKLASQPHPRLKSAESEVSCEGSLKCSLAIRARRPARS